jgi:hypothetical protein
MTLKNPGIFFRALILGAQGVFYNMFFVSAMSNIPRAPLTEGFSYRTWFHRGRVIVSSGI